MNLNLISDFYTIHVSLPTSISSSLFFVFIVSFRSTATIAALNAASLALATRRRRCEIDCLLFLSYRCSAFDSIVLFFVFPGLLWHSSVVCQCHCVCRRCLVQICAGDIYFFKIKIMSSSSVHRVFFSLIFIVQKIT